MTAVDMYDAIHANVSHIPATAPKVLGYISGTADVQWTDPDWAKFPDAGHDLMEQGFTLTQGQILAATSFDVERGAITPAQVPGIVHTRLTHGIGWTTVYAGDANLAAVETALAEAANIYGHGWYYGHVHSHLADWSLTRTEAEALLGSEIHGLGCVAVQWDHQTYFDVSVAEAAWCPPKPPVPQVPAWLIGARAAAENLAADAADLAAILKANQ